MPTNDPAEAVETNTNLQTAALAKRIETFVKQRDFVTFAELVHHLGVEYPLEGELSLVTAGDRNLILWAGMSRLFYEAVVELLHGGQVVPQPTSILTYLIDGRSLTLRLAQRPPKSGYKKPHWLPVCLRHRDRLAGWPAPRSTSKQSASQRRSASSSHVSAKLERHGRAGYRSAL